MSTKIQVSDVELGGNELSYVSDVVTSRRFTQGKYVESFERMMSAMHARPAIAMMNGSSALHAALVAMGVGPGDEVLVPAITYIATANAVAYTGARPIICDVDKLTWNLDVNDCLQKMTAKTVGIIPVHLYGNPCHMGRLKSLANAHDLWICEDAAEALGATWKGQRVGTFGQAAMFSFFGNKIVTCGEGGIVMFSEDSMMEARLRRIRGQGQHPSQRYYHDVLGYNYRMTDLQAAVGVAQMEQFGYFQARRAQVWSVYERAFMANPVVQQQAQEYEGEHAHWMFTVLFKTQEVRDAVAAALAKDDIETRPMFRPLTDMPMYGSQGTCAVAEDISRRGLSLPTHTGLTAEDQVRIVAQVLNAAA